jgi:uncharacterized phage protein gp47/JayE
VTSPVAATISATGISAPTFAQIQAYLVGQFQAIYGSDSYLGNDSQDGQWIGTVAQAISDCNSAAVAVYNSFSPNSGVGAGLSSNVKINGLIRIPGSFSIATLTLTGVANTTIVNGVAQDTSGNQWALPSPTVIPTGGSIDVTAVCTTLGATTAAENAINSIATPVYGWQTVNNSAQAIPGIGVEADAALRVRQAASVALPSQNVFDGILAAIAQVPGVTRLVGYENNTSSANGNGIPANTLAFVVEAGITDGGVAIATAIASKITPGIGTYQTGSGYSNTVIDSQGYSKLVVFMTPIESSFLATISVHTLNGWASATEALITAAVSAYFSSLAIGGIVNIAAVIAAAMLAGTPQFGTFLVKTLTVTKNSGSPQSTDFTLAFNEAAAPGVSTVATV